MSETGPFDEALPGLSETDQLISGWIADEARKRREAVTQETQNMLVRHVQQRVWGQYAHDVLRPGADF